MHNTIERSRFKLQEELRAILEEARVVIPGVQTLLGFQLIAVFNQLFPKSLSKTMQFWHLASMGLTAFAMILIMSPASYHRLAGHQISDQLVRKSSRFLMAGMFALATGICIDFQLIANVIVMNDLSATLMAGILFLLFLCQWFVFPLVSARGKQ